jgi:hypothetical protein
MTNQVQRAETRSRLRAHPAQHEMLFDKVKGPEPLTCRTGAQCRSALLLGLLRAAPVFLAVNAIEPQQVRSETTEAFQGCPSVMDHVVWLRCSQDRGPFPVQDVRPGPASRGTWRFVRTPNPRGGPDAVSIMQTVDPSRSDIDLAGLTLRCSEREFDVLIVLLNPFSPHAHPKVSLTTRATKVDFEGTVISPGTIVLLPAEAAALVTRSWRSASELAVKVDDGGNAVQGVISLVGLGSALSLLTSNCPSR